MDLSSVLSPALLTSDLSGVSGRIKAVPDEFEVEEIAAYEPSGAGEFLFLWIEKRGMGAEFFTRHIAKKLEIPPGEVGTAGLKDRHAVTRQWVSVPAVCEPRLANLDGDGVRVLKVSRHGNKLRLGHLHGNRFRILIRDANLQAGIDRTLERLRERGFPNYYGPQRFGRDAENLHVGLAMLRGEQAPRMGPFRRKLILSAGQSALFNHYLHQRLMDGLLHRVLPGDVMAKIPFGGMFVAQDVAIEQARFEAREIVSAGPIFGRKTFAAADAAAAREAETLEHFGLTTASFHGFGKLLQGTRRHNLVYPTDLSAVMEADGLRLSFALPAGSYATVLLREIMKCEVGGADEHV